MGRKSTLGKTEDHEKQDKCTAPEIALLVKRMDLFHRSKQGNEERAHAQYARIEQHFNEHIVRAGKLAGHEGMLLKGIVQHIDRIRIAPEHGIAISAQRMRLHDQRQRSLPQGNAARQRRILAEQLKQGTDDKNVMELKSFLLETMKENGLELSIHDFRTVIGHTHTNMIFDVVLPFDHPLSEDQIKEKISSAINKKREDCYCVITVDRG